MIDISIPLGLSETVELLIKNNQIQKFNFSDSLINLDNCLLHGVVIRSNTYGKTLHGSEGLAVADIRHGFITLVSIDKKKQNVQLPLELLTNSGFGRDNIFYLQPKEISIRESFIEMPQIAAVALPPAGAVITFTFFYNKISK